MNGRCQKPRVAGVQSRERFVDDLDSLTLATLTDDALKTLLASPNICSKHWVYEQYDTMVRTNTAILPGCGRGRHSRQRNAPCDRDVSGRQRQICRDRSARREQSSRSPRPPAMSSASVLSRSLSQTASILPRPSGLR